VNLWVNWRLPVTPSSDHENAVRTSTDRARWLDEGEFIEDWSPRSSYAAALCAKSRWICDIGCGKQTLRRLLPPGKRYLPADLKKWTADTEECELNEGRLPIKSLRVAETCTLLGVIEYMVNAPWLLSGIASYCDVIICSYNASDVAKQDRAAQGWINHYRLNELSQMVLTSGFTIDYLARIDETQVMLRGRKTPSLARWITRTVRRPTF
jgi:hypothetical protein